jgi:hypothetical protein
MPLSVPLAELRCTQLTRRPPTLRTQALVVSTHVTAAALTALQVPPSVLGTSTDPYAQYGGMAQYHAQVVRPFGARAARLHC